jgi:hypothetical protein
VRHGRAVVGAGIALIGAALVVVLGAWMVDRERHDDAVRGLARAASGCETSIELGATGEYWLYLERSGEAPELPGNCEQAVAAGDGLDVEVEAPDGRRVEIDTDDSRSYDRAGFQGTSIGSIDITSPGTHQFRVTSDEGGVVAVGRDVGEAGVAWVVVVLAAVGLLAVGLGLVLLGARPSGVEPPVPGAPLPPPFTGLSDFVPVTSPPLVAEPAAWSPPPHPQPTPQPTPQRGATPFRDGA